MEYFVPLVGELVAPLIGFNWTLLMVLITFAILYFLMKKFFFDKLHTFMEARTQKVIDSYDNAEKVTAEADAKLAEYSAKLDSAESERREIIKEAKAAADKRAESIVSDAEAKASMIIKQAEREAELEKAAAVEDMKEHLSLLAIYAAEKIIEKELDAEAQRDIIDGIIKEAGNEAWTH